MFVHLEIKAQLSFSEGYKILNSVEQLVKRIGDKIHEIDKVFGGDEQ